MQQRQGRRLLTIPVKTGCWHCPREASRKSVGRIAIEELAPPWGVWGWLVRFGSGYEFYYRGSCL